MTGFVPPARGAPYNVAFCCLGNICRSPMADVVLRSYADRAGLGDLVAVSSCGTGDWHVGEPMHRQAAAVLRAAGLDPAYHRARQFDVGWLDHDLLLAMDAANLATIRRLAGQAGVKIEPGRVRLFRDFDPMADQAGVPDPYGGTPDDYRATFDIVHRTCAELVRQLTQLF